MYYHNYEDKIISMRTTATFIAFLLLPIFAFSKVSFFQGSLNEAQRAAAIEGKLYFIDFYADYCLPCKLMDETTFMDEDLAAYIDENYVPLRLNIDAFDAYEVRSQHKVGPLPTIMIFNSAGELLETQEGSLTASAMHKLLEKHNTPQNRQKTTPPPIDYLNAEIDFNQPESTYTNVPIIITEETEEESEPEVLLTPPTSIVQYEAPVAPVDPIINSVTAVPPMKPLSVTAPTKVEIIEPTVTSSPDIARPNQFTALGLYEFTATRYPAKGYAIQIGVFAKYSNVLIEVQKIQELFPSQKVLVHIDELNNRTVYRIAIGAFESYSDTNAFLPVVKNAGFEGFVKDLKTL